MWNYEHMPDPLEADYYYEQEQLRQDKEDNEEDADETIRTD